MGDSVEVVGRGELYSAITTYKKESKNKRKYLAEYPLDMIDASALSLTEFPRYELLKEKLRNTPFEIEPHEAGPGTYFNEDEKDHFEQDEWDDPMVCELQELLMSNLLEIFRSAIKKIVESGYSEETAEQLILRSGLNHGAKDVVSNVVDCALAVMTKEKEFETLRRPLFENLDNLVNYTLLEMIALVRDFKQCSTVAEAMWWLLIYDLIISQCLADQEHLGGFYIPEISEGPPPDPAIVSMKPEPSETSDANLNKLSTLKPSDLRGENSHPELPAVAVDTQPSNLKHSPLHGSGNAGKESLAASQETRRKSLGTNKEHVTKLNQALVEEKASLNRKASTGNSKRDMLRQKTFHFEKSYKGHMSKGSLKAKLTSWGSMVLDKSLKSPSGSSGVVMKNTYSKITTSIGPDTSPPEGTFSVSSNSTQGPGGLSVKETVFALPAVNSKKAPPSSPETKSSPKAQSINNSSSEVPDYYAGIPYDDSLGKYVPQDDKEETILILVSHMKTLQKRIEFWRDWANEMIMQATRRLRKDQLELKILRLEKEEADKFKKEMPALEEGSMKRLSEMENAISNATAQIEAAKVSIHRLEEENNVLKSEAEDARLMTLPASANLTEAVLKEQEALKRCQLGDTEKVSLQEELTTLKHHPAELRQQLEKAELHKNQIEGLWKQEEKERLKFQGQAKLLRKETEQLKAQTKADEDAMRDTDERNTRQCMEEVMKLEKEISELRFGFESSRIAELLGGVDLNNYASGGLIGNKLAQGFQVPPKVNKRLAVFKDNFGAGGSVSPERECVMCLTEEMSVVFVPCAHQVLCAECNALHVKQGMHDCPSCRTPIQKRIAVRYINKSEHHFEGVRNQ